MTRNEHWQRKGFDEITLHIDVKKTIADALFEEATKSMDWETRHKLRHDSSAYRRIVRGAIQQTLGGSDKTP